MLEGSSSDSFDKNMEILEVERIIAHMEVDLSHHQSQTRFFEKKIMEGQNQLEMLRRRAHPHSRSHFHHKDSHSHFDETGEEDEV